MGSARALRHSERGAALLMAMLTVTLVATFAAASLWQQWRSVEVEAAERSRVQSSWVLTGTLDWARLILREDARSTSSSNIDHLGEPWAVPLQESRLSTFLAADRDHVGDPNDDVDAFLSGQIVDLQSRLNVTNLIDGTKISDVSFKAFTRLFEQLNLPQQELATMAENLRLAAAASAKTTGAASGDGPVPLVPERADELGWLGLSPATVALLQPFVTVLPAHTPVNLNTASVEVLQASIAGLSRADAQRLATARARNPFRTTAEAMSQLNQDALVLNDEQSVTSSYFEVLGRLRIGPTVVIERSLVRRSGIAVTTLWRERVAADQTVAADTGAPR